MPPFERSTTGLWVDVPQPILDIMRKKGINAAEAIHAAEHAFLNQFPMAADVKTECKVPVKEYMASDTKRKRPARSEQFLTITPTSLMWQSQVDLL